MELHFETYMKPMEYLELWIQNHFMCVCHSVHSVTLFIRYSYIISLDIVKIYFRIALVGLESSLLVGVGVIGAAWFAGDTGFGRIFLFVVLEGVCSWERLSVPEDAADEYVPSSEGRRQRRRHG